MTKNYLSGRWLLGVLLIVAGILFCFCGDKLIQFIIIGAGALFIVQAVMDLIQKMTLFGVIEAVIGVIIILCGSLILTIALYVVGALLVGAGVLAIVRLGAADKTSLIMSICAIILGVMLIVAEINKDLDWLYIVIGIISIIGGVSVFVKDKNS